MTVHPATARAVIFDYDDTLVRTMEAKWAQHRHVAREHFAIDLTDSLIAEVWGQPLPEVVRQLYRIPHDHDVAGALELVYRYNDRYPKLPFVDTMPTLTFLKTHGFRVGIITSTTRRSLAADVDRLSGLFNSVEYIQTADDTEYYKPDRRVFEPAKCWLRSIGIGIEDALYVGDSLLDARAANDVGMNFVGVATGLISTADFRANGYIAIAELREITPILSKSS